MFRQGFNDHGMPGVLRGARRIVDFLTWGDKFLPEDTPEGQGEVYTGRLIEMPERDLKQALSHLVKSANDVVLPLPLTCPPASAGRPEPLDGPSRDNLAAAARLIRQTDDTVMVCATLPAGNAGRLRTKCCATPPNGRCSSGGNWRKPRKFRLIGSWRSAASPCPIPRAGPAKLP